MGLTYYSTFSGVEAASLAWEPLGWRPLLFSEVDPFCRSVLDERWPGVPNLGDITEINWKKAVGKYGRPDLVVGGSPCQSFSIAGKREGLKGESGLMYEFVRCVHEVRPRWFLWENVPGALSSERGEAFRQLLSEMAVRGRYGLSWRILDAQFFGVPQRRRRLFLVGRAGNGFREACEVLFEPDCVPGNSGTSKEKRAELAAEAGRGARSAGFVWNQGVKAGSMGIGDETSPTARADHEPAAYAVRTAQTGANGIGVVEESAHTVDASGPEAVAAPDCLTPWDVQSKRIYSETGTTGALPSGTNEGANIQPVVAIAANQRGEVRLDGGDGDTVGAVPARPSGKQPQAVLCMTDTQSHSQVSEDLCGSLSGTHGPKDPPVTMVTRCGKPGGGKGALLSEDVSLTLSTRNEQSLFDPEDAGMTVRRLTPLECERLQGMPDGHTKVPYRGRPADECPDGPRYRAIGNSMCVNVMRWIGERVQIVEERQVADGEEG